MDLVDSGETTMRVQTIICAAVLGTLGFACAASAQGDQRREGNAPHATQQRDDQHRGDAQRPAARRAPEREMGNRGDREREYSAQNWHRGDRLPAQYRDRRYVVDNWREHRLAAPPRGYQWVQIGADYVLVSVGSGVIAQLTLAR
jgi:Ni/Co efflux regulator RcnB